MIVTGYRDARCAVEEALASGWTLAEIERAIDRPALALSDDERAALWLYADGQLDLHPGPVAHHSRVETRRGWRPRRAAPAITVARPDWRPR